MIKTIQPKNEQEWLKLRTKDITSSEVAALFGISPYSTLFELWHRKKDNIAIEWNEYMRWGTRLQDAIAQGVAEDNGWKIRRMDEYMRDSALRMGSSFDFCIEGVKPIEEMNQPITATQVDSRWDSKGILEVKNVHGMMYKNDWLENDDGTVEAPPHIEIQVQHQLAISGMAFAYIAALIGGNKVVLVKRTPDPAIIDAIKAKVVQFWASIEKNTPPPPDFAIDSEFISKLYGYSEPGKILSAENDAEIATLAGKYKEARAAEKIAKTAKDAAKAELLTKIGDCEKVFGNGFSITAGTVGPVFIEAYERKGFRMFKVNWKKTK